MTNFRSSCFKAIFTSSLIIKWFLISHKTLASIDSQLELLLASCFPHPSVITLTKSDTIKMYVCVGVLSTLFYCSVLVMRMICTSLNGQKKKKICLFFFSSSNVLLSTLFLSLSLPPLRFFFPSFSPTTNS